MKEISVQKLALHTVQSNSVRYSNGIISGFYIPKRILPLPYPTEVVITITLEEKKSEAQAR